MDWLFITTLQEAGEDMEASVPYNILSFEPHIKLKKKTKKKHIACEDILVFFQTFLLF